MAKLLVSTTVAAALVSTSSAFSPPAAGTSALRRGHSATSALRAVAAPPVPAAEAPAMAECPETVWGTPFDVRAEQAKMREAEPRSFPLEVEAADALGGEMSDAAQLAYFEANREQFAADLANYGAIVLRGFPIATTPEGFQQLYATLGLEACLDPLHSVAARPTVGGKGSPVYEAVNKESRKNFFIGMHNEFVGKRAPRRAAFVCFKAAEEGGEFLLCDGRQVFRDLDTDLLESLYQRSIRYSVMELPFFEWIDGLPEVLRDPAQGVVKAAVTAALNAKVDFDVELVWGADGRSLDGTRDGVRMLQARAPVQPPAVRHPDTGEPTWFCNVHSHSSKLRKDREEIYGAERFESGASQINKSDMFFGDDSKLTDVQLEQLDKATVDNIKYVPMKEGDVVLVDNYACMHGRNVFEGTRKHAVTWFK